MREISLTQGKVAIVDDEDYEWLSRWKWFYGCGGYAGRHFRLNGKHNYLSMHRTILEVPPGMEIDHKNRNRLDNRRENLRVCTRSQNEANRGIFPNNTSGIKGVSWDKVNKKWRAAIVHNCKYIHIGRYGNIEDASAAFEIKAKELFGEFAYQEAI